MKTFIFSLFLLLICPLSFASHNQINPNNENVECKVVGVSDGDTFTCLTMQKQRLKIRLSSIDAPEKSQAFGQKSKQKLSDLIFGKQVIVSIENQDKYERYIAEVFKPNDNYSINYQMVFHGLAWSYDRYLKDNAYKEAENLAKTNKIGLWSDPNPINPEQYRHLK